MSSKSHQLSIARKTFKNQGQGNTNIETNLEKLGLLGDEDKRRRAKRKVVGFQNPVSDNKTHPTIQSRTSSRNFRITQFDDESSIPKAGVPNSRRGMAAVLDIERSRTRKDRTFVGSECTVCEEKLEYTLRGERILQLSCGHIAHEACFYEHIREFESQYCPTCKAPLGLDSSRGGNVLDIEKLSNIIRAHPSLEQREHDRGLRASLATWDTGPGAQPSRPREFPHHLPSSLHEASLGIRPLSHSQRHIRNDSTGTGMVSLSEHQDVQSTSIRKHDYDVQSMETSLGSPRTALKNPIPAPSVTVRSEFPTLTRSRVQQSLTCLITVEVPEGIWRPSAEDLHLLNHPTSAGHDVGFSEQNSLKSPVEATIPRHGPELDLDAVTEELHSKVDNWHGLDFSRFGKLRLHSHIRVGKDCKAWQDLDCYLFSEMLICVKERKLPHVVAVDGASTVEPEKARCTLKGSILIKKHLNDVETNSEENILTLSLSVKELPSFHLQFQSRQELELWKRSLLDINNANQASSTKPTEYDFDYSGTDDEDYRTGKANRLSSINSSYGAAKSHNTAATEYSRNGIVGPRLVRPFHVPLDIVVVIPVSSSMQGLKITLLRDTLKFLISSLGERDRMGLVTFGSSGGGVPIVGMTSKVWNGWPKILESIRPMGQKSLRADVVEGANVAMDLLMQRKSTNPLSSILLISDSSTSDRESVDFVIQRAEAAKVTIHSFGLGLAHKPDTMIELSTRTKASYTYVKDWMMLVECVAGCLGSLQTTSHQNVKLKLRLPEGSTAKFMKISGALHITKRASGRDAEAALGDMRFGDKRDVLVQLVIAPDNASTEQLPQDPWETILSGLEALGGNLEQDEPRNLSVEEIPLIQADLVFGDILRDGAISHLPRPSLLTITMLPSSPRAKTVMRSSSTAIPPHPSVVQRRMELLTSDMLTRALTLVSRGQHERAHRLLTETRSILKGLGKGGLPPLPTPVSQPPAPPARSPGAPLPTANGEKCNPSPPPSTSGAVPDRKSSSSSPPVQTIERNTLQSSSCIDVRTVAALDAELESSLEWINHPAVFSRDARKSVLQAIGVISSQRAYTFRTAAETLWAERIAGVILLVEKSRGWRHLADDAALMEEN